MSKIMMWFKKTFLVAVVAGLGLSALPVASAFALSLNDTAAPPVLGQISNARLEKIWAREQALYVRIGRLFDRADIRIARAQMLIDKAKANGKDVSALQAALDTFSAAVKQARSAYDGGQSLIASHPGFDSVGKVTDATQAQATVKSMQDLFKQLRLTVAGPRSAFLQAARVFRQANQPNGK